MYDCVRLCQYSLLGCSRTAAVVRKCLPSYSGCNRATTWRATASVRPVARMGMGA